MNLDNIVEINRQVPLGPIANDIDLRRFFGANRPLPTTGKENVNIDKEIKGITDDLQEIISGALAQPTVHADLPKNLQEAYQKVAPAIRTAAQTHGVPEQLLTSLIKKESSFNPNASGPVVKSGSHQGDRAVGLGQVMAKTAASFGVTDRSSLSPDQQVDLAARILADNKKAGGTWKDAVSRYFTGVDYETAKREGRSDGFNSVIQYVEDVS